MTRVVGYARVSTKEQANDSNALLQQIDRLKAAGAIEIFSDVESGWKKNTRPQLEDLMAQVRSGKVTEVIVTRLDRLSRQGLKSFQIFEEFLNVGAVLRALDEPFDLTTAAGRAMAGQLIVFAQFHSDQKAESVRAGWAHLRNKKVAMQPPFGYLKVDDAHILDCRPFLCLLDDRREMSKSEIAREIVEAFLKQQTLRLALREINERYGLKVFAHNNTAGKKLGGRIAQDLFRFSPGGLKNWLTSPVLRGHLVYLRGTPREQIYLNTHLEARLISEEESREIERILNFNRKVRGFGTTALKYPCSGLVYCAQCRGACYSISGVNNYHRAKRLGIPIEHNHYFQCNNWRSRACENKKTIRMEIVEKCLVVSLITRAQAIADIMQTVPAKVESPQVRALREQVRALRAIGENPAINSAIVEIEKQISQLLLTEDKEMIDNEFQRELLISCFSHPELWLEADIADRQRVYRELTDKILISDGEVVDVVLKI